MGRKKATTTQNTPVIGSEKKNSDRWSLIENGEATSAAQVHYKEQNGENRKLNIKKRKRLNDGLIDGEDRILAHPPPRKSGGKKRSAVEDETLPTPKSNKKLRTIDETIVLGDTPVRKSMALLKNTDMVDSSAEDTMDLFNSTGRRSSLKNRTFTIQKEHSEKRKSSKKGEEMESRDSSTYIVEDPDDDEVTVVSNGREQRLSKTIVIESNDSDIEDEDDGDSAGLDSDLDSDVDESIMQNILTKCFDKSHEVEGEEDEMEDEMEGEMEDEEDEIENEESEIDENEMQIDPQDIERVVEDDMEISEENDDEEDDEEIEDEEGISDEESEVSEMEDASDDEGFISGAHREPGIIEASGEKKNKKRHTVLAELVNPNPIDFDSMPFSGEDSVANANRAFAYLVSSCDVQTFFDNFYQSSVLVVHRKQPNYYGNLFSTARFVELMENNYLEYGVNINIAEYNNGVRKTMNEVGRVYPQMAKQHLKSLRSIQLVNPQTFDDRIWYLCEILQELFGCFVGANTYLTPAGSSGFAPHWDEIDAFLLQVEGRKYWRVWGPEKVDDELPLESSGNFTEEDMKNRKPVFEGWVEAGDILYIPRGFIHQARTDKKVHSLHVTVSTGRRWSFADMLKKIIPEAIDSMTMQRVKMRRGLPIGLLDMGGVIDLKYSQCEHFGEKFQMVFDRHMSQLRTFVADHAYDSAVDLMAKEFMKQALPPKLTEEEKKLSVVGKAVNLWDDELVEFSANTKIKLIRKHTQRLVMEDENSCFVAHRMNNSRLFEGRPEQNFEYPCEAIDVYSLLSDFYPEWRTINEVLKSKRTKAISRSAQLAAIQLLFKNGVLLVKN